MGEVKKCPKCSGGMEKGYIHAPRGIYWHTKRHKLFGPRGETIKSMWSWHIPSAPALRCKRCRIIIFDYGVAG